jgi:hypothetical protein
MKLERHTAFQMPSKQPDQPTSLSLQVPRSFIQPGSIPLHSDKSQSPEEDIRNQYALSQKATIREDVDQKQHFFGQSSQTLPSDFLMVHEVFEEQDCDYSYSLYPGIRSCIRPGSVTAIICHHVGITPHHLKDTANVWSRASADTNEIHVALLKKDFGLVLPAKVACDRTSKSMTKARSVTRASTVNNYISPFSNFCTGNGGQRSDFEASAFMAFMPARGDSLSNYLGVFTY